MRRRLRIFRAHGEKPRYLIVGGLNTLISYGLFVALLASLGTWLQTFSGSSSGLVSVVGVHYYLVVQWVAWVLSVPVSTLMMKRFVFRSKGHRVRQIGRAYLIYLPAQGLATVLLWLTVQVIHLSPQLGVIVTVAITTVLTYVGHKYFTFRLPLELGEIPPEKLLK